MRLLFTIAAAAFISACGRPEPEPKQTWSEATDTWGGKTFKGGQLTERRGDSVLQLTCNEDHILGRVSFPKSTGEQSRRVKGSLSVIASGGTVIWYDDTYLSTGGGDPRYTFSFRGEEATLFKQRLRQGRFDIYVGTIPDTAYFDAQDWGIGSAFTNFADHCKI